MGKLAKKEPPQNETAQYADPVMLCTTRIDVKHLIFYCPMYSSYEVVR